MTFCAVYAALFVVIAANAAEGQNDKNINKVLLSKDDAGEDGLALPKSEFAKLLISDIRQYAPEYPFIAANVRKSVARASHQTGLPNPDDDDCHRDYAILCPYRWVPAGDGVTCRAPATYTGTCGPVSDFTGFTPLKKLFFASECKAPWPCDTRCVEDFEMPCPSGWQIDNEGICRAPNTYHGSCIRTADLRKLLPEHKRLWGEICSVQWPCKPTCVPDTKKRCPSMWTVAANNSLCVAPYSYLGPCSPLLPSTKPQDEFVSQCRVTYDCEVSPEGKDDICDRDYSIPCPRGWELEPNPKGFVCRAKMGYSGPCAWRFPLERYNETMKKAFANACDVEWQCKTPKSLLSTSAVSPHPISKIVKPKSPRHSGSFDDPQVASGPWDSYHYKFVDGTVTMSEMDKKKPPEQQTETASAISIQQVHRHKKLLEEFIAAAGNNVPPEIVQAVYDGLNSLGVQAADTQIRYRFEQIPLGADADSATTTTTTLAPVLTPLDTKMEQVELKKAGLYRLDTLLRHIFDLSEPGFFMKRIGFPTIAYKEKQRIVLLDNLAAEADTYTGLGGTDHCARDYSQPCPEGWEVAGGTQCLAPESYIGECSRSHPFGLFSQTKKMSEEIRCNVKFPCRICDHDYIRSPCQLSTFGPLAGPQGWFHEGKGICRAADWLVKGTRNRKCPTVMNFKYMVPQLRRSWAQQCGYDWPCFQECQRDMAYDCPEDFVKSGDPQGLANEVLCKPIKKKYEGPCSLPLKIPNSIPERYKLEVHCLVRWPCRKLCSMKFWQGCPFGFTFKLRQCERPDTAYAGLCPPMQKFGFLFLSPYKKKYVNRCHAPWPCKGECEQDFSQTCPSMWWKSRTANGRTFCEPLVFYKGPCQGSQYDFTGFGLAAKMEFSWKCEVRWPCGGHVFGIPMIGSWMTERKREWPGFEGA